MRKIFTFILFMFAITTIAQVPQGFNYQAVIRNSSGDIIQDQNVSVRISILQGSTTGNSEYTETHSTQTNAFGLINLIIGQGESSDNFTTIDWSNLPYYLKIDIDLNDGSGYTEFGTSQLLSVPFAMYAGNTENSDDADADPTNELQVLSISNDTIYLSQGSFVKLPEASVPQQFSVSEFGDTLYLSNGNSIVIPGISINNYNYPKLGSFIQDLNIGNYITTNDDNIIYGSSDDENDFILTKLDTLGNEIWKKAYNIDTLNPGYMSSIINTNDNGYLSIWSFEYFNPEPNNYTLLIKFDSSGDTLWTRLSNYESKIYQLSDNNFLTNSTKNISEFNTVAVLSKLNEAGDTLWSKQYDFIYNENSYIKSILETSDGSILFVSGGMSNILVKTNNIGDTIWTKNLTGMSFIHINETVDNNYLIVSDYNCKVTKLTPDNSVVWEKEFETDFPYNDRIKKSFCLPNGNILLIGSTESDGAPVTQSAKLGETDIWYLLINSSGTEISSKYYGGSLVETYQNSFMLSNNRILIISESNSYNGYVPNDTPLTDGLWIFTLSTN